MPKSRGEKREHSTKKRYDLTAALERNTRLVNANRWTLNDVEQQLAVDDHRLRSLRAHSLLQWVSILVLVGSLVYLTHTVGLLTQTMRTSDETQTEPVDGDRTEPDQEA